MKTFRLFITLLCISLSNVNAQNIIAAEYFFDSNDLGFGNNYALPVSSPAPQITFNTGISMSSLNIQTGLHTFNFRVKNSDNIWSQLTTRLITILPDSGNIVAAEYFFDNDPGAGNGNPIIINSPSTNMVLPLNIQASSFPKGLHTFNFRTKNSGGVWSQIQTRLILIDKDNGDQYTNAEAYVDGPEPGVGNATPVHISSTGIIENDSLLLGSLSLGMHKIYLRARHSNGVWTHYAPLSFNVCTTYGAVSDFALTVEGKTVYVNDDSHYENTHNWNFGDGSSSTLVNTTHTYTNGGTYNIRLITSNPCATDTLIKTVSIKGIQFVEPNEVSDSGAIMINLTGYGFKTSSQVKIYKAGQGNIVADTTYYLSGTRLRAIFNFATKKSDGSWSVIVSSSNSPDDTLVNGLQLAPAKNSDLWVKWSGQKYVLRNLINVYQVIVGNNGNQMKFGIPVTIKIDSGRTVYLLTPSDNSGISQNVLDSVNHFELFYDSVANKHYSLGVFMIPYIEPNSVKKIQIGIISPNTGQANLKVSINDAWYNYLQVYPTGQSSSCGDLPPCVQCALDIGGLIPNPYLSCAISNLEFACSLKSQIANDGPNTFSVLDLVAKSTDVLSDCILGPVSEVKGLAKKVIQEALEGFKDGWDMGDIAGGEACGTCGVDAVDFFRTYILNAFDPNEKTGTAGPSALNYIRPDINLDYRISFENDDSASAPVIQADIFDKIDTTVFDKSSFAFTGFGFGDSAVYFKNQLDSFTVDVDLRSSRHCILRVIGKFDSKKGICTTRFIALDTLSRDLVPNILNGFLPPNITPPEGQAFISYSIKPKSNLPNLQALSNSATITFIGESPIVTDAWVNTIDKVAPSSNVLPLPPCTTDSIIKLRLSGMDNESGIQSYDIYVSINDSTYFPFVRGLLSDSILIKIKPSTKYEFYCIALDSVGNTELAPSNPALNPDAVIYGLNASTAISVSKTEAACSNFPNGTATATANFGVPPYSYLWNNGHSSSMISGLDSGNYIVTITDVGGCSASKSIRINYQPPVTISMTVSNVTCKGTATGAIAISLISGNSPFSFLWSNGSTNQNLINAAIGNYIVSVTDVNGCTTSAGASIAQSASQLVLSFSKTNNRCGGSSKGSATMVASGGVLPYSYLWSNGITLASASSLVAGIYTCTVTDAAGCIKSKAVIITQNPPLLLTVLPLSSVSAAASVSGGISAYSYLWNSNPSQTKDTANALNPGATYKVRVMDSKGCTKIATIVMPLNKGAAEELETCCDVTIIPNPNNGLFTLQLIANENGQGLIEFYDITGRLISEQNLESMTGINHYRFDFGNLTKGAYLLKLKLGTKLFTRLFTIK